MVAYALKQAGKRFQPLREPIPLPFVMRGLQLWLTAFLCVAVKDVSPTNTFVQGISGTPPCCNEYVRDVRRARGVENTKYCDKLVTPVPATNRLLIAFLQKLYDYKVPKKLIKVLELASKIEEDLNYLGLFVPDPCRKDAMPDAKTVNLGIAVYTPPVFPEAVTAATTSTTSRRTPSARPT